MPNRILNNKFEQKRTGINYIFEFYLFHLTNNVGKRQQHGHKECQDRWEKYSRVAKRKPRARHCYPYQIIRYSTICYLALLSRVALWWQVEGAGSCIKITGASTQNRWRCAEKLFICAEAGGCYCLPLRSWQRGNTGFGFSPIRVSFMLCAPVWWSACECKNAKKLVRIKYVHVHWLSGDRIIIWFENIKLKNVPAIFHSAANRLKSVMLVVAVTRSRTHTHTHIHLNPFISSHIISTRLMASRVYLVYRWIGVFGSQ